MSVCRNCGWDNPGGSLKCEKCGKYLSPSVHPVGAASRPVEIPKSKDHNACSSCGYPLVDFAKVCPYCGTSVAGKRITEPDVAPRPATVMDTRNEPQANIPPRNSTVRDVSPDMLSSVQVYHLIPAQGNRNDVIELRIGEYVQIDGKKYYFTK